MRGMKRFLLGMVLALALMVAVVVPSVPLGGEPEVAEAGYVRVCVLYHLGFGGGMYYLHCFTVGTN